MTPFYKVLAYFTALPFICGAAALFLFGNPGLHGFLLAFLLLYAAVLACFHGGIHWAHALIQHNEGQLWLSMAGMVLSLALAGWGLGLIMMDMMASTLGSVLLSLVLSGYILLYLAIWVMDAQWLDKTYVPDGYMLTRTGVTFGITASLMAIFLFLWV